MSWLAEPLRTERLSLRPTRPGDGTWIKPMLVDAEVRKYLGGALTEDEARERTKITGERWGHFALALRETGEAVGTLSFEKKTDVWELSFSLRRNAWGKGYMEEAVRAALPWFFKETGEDEVTATTQTANERARRLLERLVAVETENLVYKGYPVKKYALRRNATLGTLQNDITSV